MKYSSSQCLVSAAAELIFLFVVNTEAADSLHTEVPAGSTFIENSSLTCDVSADCTVCLQVFRF